MTITNRIGGLTTISRTIGSYYNGHDVTRRIDPLIGALIENGGRKYLLKREKRRSGRRIHFYQQG